MKTSSKDIDRNSKGNIMCISSQHDRRRKTDE
jgi:hypothetical protein